MIKFIAGEKGQGKTKKLIALANTAVKATDGHIIFIDDDKRHIYDLHYDIRFVDTASFPLLNYREFVGFLYGILSMDSDIKEVFVDGLTNIIKTLDSDSITKLVSRLERISEENSLDFTISINCKTDDLPDNVRGLVM